MSFVLPELVIESILRDGFENIRRDESIIDDVFAQLLKPFASKKYGEKEINKIKKLLKDDVAIVHSFNDVNKRTPCISIQLIDNAEMENLARMDDFEDDVRKTFDDPEDLANLIRVPDLIIWDYDPLSGKVLVDDSIDLSEVYPNLLFEDGIGQEFQILAGVNNTPGNKSFFIEKQADVDISEGLIKSSLNFEQFERRGTTESENILLGIHTKEALLTKYLYILVKYIINSRRPDMDKRCFILATYTGSDFSRMMDQQADHVYTRFLTIKGRVENSWTSDKVQLIDSVQIQVEVEKDIAGPEEFPDATVIPHEDD